MTKRIFLSLILLFFAKGNFAAPAAKDTLSKAIRMIQRGDNDSLRFTANAFLSDSLFKVISIDSNFITPLNQFNNISIVLSPDRRVRICSWIVPHYDGEKYSYFGYLQLRDEKKKTFTTIVLKDSTESIEKPESAKLNPGKWFGACYYAIIPVTESGKTSYTLIGWKGKNQRVTQKVIDVLAFEKGLPVFGKSIFKTQSVYKSRMIYSFAAQASMTLRFEKNKNRIVIDHISSSSGDKSAVLSGPDGSYDAFELKKGKWLLVQDIDVDANVKKPGEIKPVKDSELFKK